MATLYIAEFGNIQAYPTTDSAQIAKAPTVATPMAMTLSSSASVISTAFSANTQIVRLYADTQCWVLFSAVGTSIATALATSIPIAAAQPEYFGVIPGQTVAALSSG
jgi:hypothetical protein